MNILRGDFLGNHVIFLKSAQNLATKLFSEWVIFPGLNTVVVRFLDANFWREKQTSEKN